MQHYKWLEKNERTIKQVAKCQKLVYLEKVIISVLSLQLLCNYSKLCENNFLKASRRSIELHGVIHRLNMC